MPPRIIPDITKLKENSVYRYDLPDLQDPYTVDRGMYKETIDPLKVFCKKHIFKPHLEKTKASKETFAFVQKVENQSAFGLYFRKRDGSYSPIPLPSFKEFDTRVKPWEQWENWVAHHCTHVKIKGQFYPFYYRGGSFRSDAFSTHKDYYTFHELKYAARKNLAYSVNLIPASTLQVEQISFTYGYFFVLVNTGSRLSLLVYRPSLAVHANPNTVQELLDLKTS